LSRHVLAATLAATLTTALVFWLWPGIDVAVARWFFVEGRFAGAAPLERAFRFFFYYMPDALLAGFAICWLLAWRGVERRWLPLVSGRSLSFLLLSAALGPLLLVNVGLKDHMHRPRPAQTAAFGGPMAFQPYWSANGGCATNCSFVSGEVSSNAWLVAPAMLAPPPFRGVAMAAAVIATILTALGRMAFGGHYLSDCLFAAFFTFLVVMASARMALGRSAPRP